MGSEWFLCSFLMLLLFSWSDFFPFRFSFLLQPCSRYCSWHKGKNFIFGPSARVTMVDDTCYTAWIGSIRTDFFTSSSFNCLCAMTPTWPLWLPHLVLSLCQEGESFRSKKDLLEQALWHWAIPLCAFSTFYESRFII